MVSGELTDPYGVVRYVAYDKLKQLPGFEDFAYDFLSPTNERENARERAVADWTNNHRQASPNPAATLQAADGSVQRQLLARFLKQRDDRPITIKE